MIKTLNILLILIIAGFNSQSKKTTKRPETFKRYKNFFRITQSNIVRFNENWNGSFIYLHSEENCDMCNYAMKSLSKLALKYNDSFSLRNRFGIIVCEKDLICLQFSSQKPPMLIYQIHGEYINFNGEFSEDSVTDFIMSKINKEPRMFDKNYSRFLKDDKKNFKMSVVYKGSYDLKDENFLIFYDFNKM